MHNSQKYARTYSGDDPRVNARFPATFTKVRGILGTESIGEDIQMLAVHDLVELGEAGAFDFLLEPGAEERMWGQQCHTSGSVRRL